MLRSSSKAAGLQQNSIAPLATVYFTVATVKQRVKQRVKQQAKQQVNAAGLERKTSTGHSSSARQVKQRVKWQVKRGRAREPDKSPPIYALNATLFACGSRVGKLECYQRLLYSSSKAAVKQQ